MNERMIYPHTGLHHHLAKEDGIIVHRVDYSTIYRAVNLSRYVSIRELRNIIKSATRGVNEYEQTSDIAEAAMPTDVRKSTHTSRKVLCVREFSINVERVKVNRILTRFK